MKIRIEQSTDTERPISLLTVAGRRDRKIDITGDRSRFVQWSQQQLVVHRQFTVVVDSDAVARDPLGNGGSIPRLETRLPSTIDAPVSPSRSGWSCRLDRRSRRQLERWHWELLKWWTDGPPAAPLLVYDHGSPVWNLGRIVSRGEGEREGSPRRVLWISLCDRMDLIEVERVKKTNRSLIWISTPIHDCNFVSIFVFRACVTQLRENALDRLWSVPEGPCDCI